MKKKPPVQKSGYNAQLAGWEAHETKPSTSEVVAAQVSDAATLSFRRRFNEDPLIRKLEAHARHASPTAQAGIAGAIVLRKGLLRTLEHETAREAPLTKKSSPVKLVLKFHGKADKKAYKRLVASAQDEPRGTALMGPSRRKGPKPAPKFDEKEDKKAYKRLLTSAQDTPSDTALMGPVRRKNKKAKPSK